jgi:hypothetical protein
MRKWNPRLNFDRMSQSLPPGWTTVRIHMDATLEPARRIISRLLQEDARFFQEYHYLNPFDVDDSEPPASWVGCICLLYSWECFFLGSLSKEVLVLKASYPFLAFAAFRNVSLDMMNLSLLYFVM